MERPEDEPGRQPPSIVVNILGDVRGRLVVAGSVNHLDMRGPTLTLQTSCSLPLAPFNLFNRKEELRYLDSVLARAETHPGPSLAILEGMHGVGKSAVGAHWVNANRTAFPDGQLYGDFAKRRRDGGVAVDEVLADFLQLLGVAPSALPDAVAERAELYRSVTAGRRVLVLLDDVRTAAEVRPLLPSGAGSVVVVTTNERLQEFVHERVLPAVVEPLDKAKSREFLDDMVGSKRTDVEPEAVGRVVELCGGFPVALSVCGGTLLTDPDSDFALVASKIEGEQTRLERLSEATPYRLGPVFEMAYVQLDEEHRHVYRSLGLHPGHEFAAPDIAALAALPVEALATTLDSLVRSHLVQPVKGRRYRLHDLIRIHAKGCSRRGDQSEADMALSRLIDRYYTLLRQADRAITPNRLRLSPEHELADPLEIADPDGAREWFEAERNNIVAVVAEAFDREWDDLVWQMVEALWPLLFNHKYYSEWIPLHEIAIASSERRGSPGAEARMRSQLARAYIELGRFEEAHDELRMAEVKADLSGNDPLRSSIREFVGICYLYEGDYAAALAALHEAREMCVDLGMTRGVALQDYHIGWALTQDGRPREAFEYIERAHEALLVMGDERTATRAMLRLGEARLAAGHLDQARSAFEDVLADARQHRLHLEEAQVHEELAKVADAEGSALGAVEREAARKIYEQLGHPRAVMLGGAPGEAR